MPRALSVLCDTWTTVDVKRLKHSRAHGLLPWLPDKKLRYLNLHLRTMVTACRSVKIASLQVAVGDVIALASADDEAEEGDDAGAPLGLLQGLWQTPKGQLLPHLSPVPSVESLLGWLHACHDPPPFFDFLGCKFCQQISSGSKCHDMQDPLTSPATCCA